MTIVQLHDESWDSGIAHYALTLSHALRERGHKILFWAAADSYAAAEARRLGLETREISKPWLSLPELREELRDQGVELVNAHTGSSHSLAALLAAGTKIAVVRTRGDVRRPAGHFLARALAARTDAYIAANRRLRDELSEAFPQARIELVHQGIALLGEPSELPAGPPAVIGVLGRLDEVKGHSDLMEAAAKLKNDFPSVKFQCAGADPSNRLAELKLRSQTLGLNGCFEFLGRVPRAADFINSCRIGVVASTGSEAVSRAALEWMQLGRPLVATTVGCLTDLVEDGRTGLLVPPHDPDALSEALARLLLDGELAARMGAEARKRFDELFGLRRFAEQTEGVYASVLA